MINVVHLFDHIHDSTNPWELLGTLSKDSEIKATAITLSLDKNLSYDFRFSEINLYILDNKTKLQKFLRLKKILQNNQFDIIHTHHSKSARLILLFKKLFRTQSVFIHSIRNSWQDYNTFSRSRTWKKFISNMDYIFCNSYNTLESIPKKFKTNTEKFKVCYNGVDIEKIQNKSFTKNYSEHTILCAARLVKQKDHKTLIEAFSQISYKFPNWLILLCGDGPLRTEISTLIHKKQLEDKILLLGNVQRDYLYKLLNEATIFVMPSLWEGFCNANVQAMAAGVPVLASNIEPMPEIVGEGGYFFQVGNPDDLAEKMEHLMKKSDLRKGLGRNGQARSSYFTITKSAIRHKEIYQHILS